MVVIFCKFVLELVWWFQTNGGRRHVVQGMVLTGHLACVVVCVVASLLFVEKKSGEEADGKLRRGGQGA